MGEAVSYAIRKIADVVARKGVSRKFAAFLLGSWLLMGNYISEESWLIVALGYMGSQGLVSMVHQVMSKKNSSSENKE